MNLTPSQKARHISQLKALLELAEALPVVTPCDLCAEFDRQSGYCARWKAPVPEEARPVGCEGWVEEVPF